MEIRRMLLKYDKYMKIYVPHFFKHHDNFINIKISSFFMPKPWYRKFRDEDIRIEFGDEVYTNYGGWLWFNLHWYSVK